MSRMGKVIETEILVFAGGWTIMSMGFLLQLANGDRTGCVTILKINGFYTLKG